MLQELFWLNGGLLKREWKMREKRDKQLLQKAYHEREPRRRRIAAGNVG